LVLQVRTPAGFLFAGVFCVLICATAVVYFVYAPWNYFPLGILFLGRESAMNGR
jgi:hypothetical protein